MSSSYIGNEDGLLENVYVFHLRRMIFFVYMMKSVVFTQEIYDDKTRLQTNF